MQMFARPEPGNDRKQELEIHLVEDSPWHEGIIVRSVAGMAPNDVALKVQSRWRDKYGSLEFQAIDAQHGYLSLVAHIPLGPFTLADPTSLINFISVFAGRADQLEEALLGGADVF